MKRLLLASLLAAGPLATPQTLAQTPELIAVQLNTSETAGDACRLTFVIQNRRAEPISKLGFDLVMFDKSDGVSGYAAVDFGALPAGKTVVRQYDVGKGGCDTISRVLLNEIRACEIGGSQDADCLSKLEVSSRSEIDFII